MLTKKTPKNDRCKKRVAKITLPDSYDGQELYLSNDLVSANFRLSLTQLRLVWMFGMLIRKADEDFRHYQVSILDVIKYLRLNERSGKVYEQIEEAVEGLLGNVLHVPQKETGGWLKFAWVASAEYRGDDGTIEFEFSDKLKPFLVTFTGNFTIAEMGQLMQIRSVYSGRIYLLLRQYLNLGKIRFGLEELRLLLSLDIIGAADSNAPYSRYQDFRRYVLERAQTELAEKTDLTFDFKPIKKGRKIREIEFVIKKSNCQTGIPSSDVPADLPAVVRKLVEAGFRRPHAARLWNMSWKSVRSDIRDEIDPEISFENYVVSKLSLLQKYRARRAVDNPVGWLVRAIQENWTDGPRKRPRVRRLSGSGKVESIAELINEMTLPGGDEDA